MRGWKVKIEPKESKGYRWHLYLHQRHVAEGHADFVWGAKRKARKARREFLRQRIAKGAQAKEKWYTI